MSPGPWLYASPMSPAVRPEDFAIGRLFEHVRDAVVVADARSERILLWNRGATEMFGYSPEEALAMPLHALVSPSLLGPHRSGLARYAETGRGELVDSGRAVEVEAIRKDGSPLTVELTLTSVEHQRSEGGRAVMALIRDATDRKAAERWREAQLNQQHALEIHDSIVQSLVVSKAYFELGEFEVGLVTLNKALQTARSLVSHLMDEREAVFGLRPGDFVRSRPASEEPAAD